MNQRYTQTELIRGRLYRYDPDTDCWYPAESTETPISRWSWIVVVLLLAMAAYYAEFMR
jgi:hypothetical protein